mmetsp:Transcript_16712/g.30274  ORF Transcript_16712/g.30274 Transcript_16712/m.30274 type:complete len:386 (-) Transcript_16712:867-2024(-)
MEDGRKFKTILSSLNSTQDSIENATKYCNFFISCSKDIVLIWLTQFKSSPPAKQSSLLYLANHIIQTSRKKGLDYVNAFQEALPHAFRHICSLPSSDRSQLVSTADRLVGIWSERKVLNETVTASLKKILHSTSLSSNSSAVASASMPRSDSQVTQNGADRVNEREEDKNQISRKRKSATDSAGPSYHSSSHHPSHPVSSSSHSFLPPSSSSNKTPSAVATSAAAAAASAEASKAAILAAKAAEFRLAEIYKAVDDPILIRTLLLLPKLSDNSLRAQASLLSFGSTPQSISTSDLTAAAAAALQTAKKKAKEELARRRVVESLMLFVAREENEWRRVSMELSAADKFLAKLSERGMAEGKLSAPLVRKLASGVEGVEGVEGGERG